jgi:hypothetical protein
VSETKPRGCSRRGLGVAALLVVALIIAVLGAMRARLLKLAAESPWSRVAVGTEFTFAVTSVTSASTHVQMRLTRLVRRDATEAEVVDDEMDGPKRTTFSLANPDLADQIAAASACPTEAVETSAGTFQCHRIDVITKDYHYVKWWAPELPLLVKLEVATPQGKRTETLVKISKPD